MSTVTTSKQFALSLNDFWKGLIVAVLSGPLTIIYTSLQAGKFDIDWKATGLMALAALVSYLIKNFFTPAQTVIKEDPQ